MAKRKRTNKGQTTHWPKEKGQTKDRQHIGQKKKDKQRTDNTLAKRRRTRGQTTIYKTQHRQLQY